MTQEHQFFGLNMLPIFLEMIEAKLEIAEKQLSSLTDVKKLAGNHKDVILKTAQNYLLEVDRFFEQCQKWYQDVQSVEEISLIGQSEKAVSSLEQTYQKIISDLS